MHYISLAILSRLNQFPSLLSWHKVICLCGRAVKHPLNQSTVSLITCVWLCIVSSLMAAIWTAAVKFMKDGELYRPLCRSVDIIADAALAILSRDARSFTGHFLEDETFLRDHEDVSDFSKYAVTEDSKL